MTVLAFYLRELTYNQAREANWADSGSRAADVGDDMASAGLPLRSSSVRCGRHIERHYSSRKIYRPRANSSRVNDSALPIAYRVIHYSNARNRCLGELLKRVARFALNA
ncbi:hypothetical protein MINTM001_22970 [Mycobacterium paraintracellulare]|nr:hypothetical protein MINTM001_22970 [Mycobacterium paraintracellulare]